MLAQPEPNCPTLVMLPDLTKPLSKNTVHQPPPRRSGSLVLPCVEVDRNPRVGSLRAKLHGQEV